MQFLHAFFVLDLCASYVLCSSRVRVKEVFKHVRNE